MSELQVDSADTNFPIMHKVGFSYDKVPATAALHLGTRQ